MALSVCSDCSYTDGCLQGCRKIPRNWSNYSLPPMASGDRGWICPRCDKVHAPSVLSCEGCIGLRLPMSNVGTTLAS